MNPNKLKTIVAQIHRRFPEFAGSQPRVRLQKAPQPVPEKLGQTYLLTFYKTVGAVKGSEGKSIPRWMRVVINERGKILKITTSR